MSSLTEKKCKPCEGGTMPMNEGQIQEALKQVPGWSYESGEIVRTFGFKNYDETTVFVNRVTEIARREDHHPQIEFGYKTCKVRYSTHAIKGISENDFICAAKINALIKI